MKVPSWITKNINNLEKYMNDPARSGVNRRQPDSALPLENSYQHQTSNYARYLKTTNSSANWTTDFVQPTSLEAKQAAFKANIATLNNGTSYCTPFPATSETVNAINQNAQDTKTEEEATKSATSKIDKSSSVQTPGKVPGLFTLVSGLFPGGAVSIRVPSSNDKYTTIIASLAGVVTPASIGTDIYIYKKSVLLKEINSAGLTLSTIDVIAQKNAQTAFLKDHPAAAVSLPSTLTSGVVDTNYITFGYAIEVRF